MMTTPLLFSPWLRCSAVFLNFFLFWTYFLFIFLV